MAKNKYLNIGSIVKGRDGKPDYIKLNQGIKLLVDGNVVDAEYVNLQNPHTLPKTLLDLKKITPEVAEQMAEKAAKRPFVRFDLQVKLNG